MSEYPSEEDLKQIESWPSTDLFGWFAYIKPCWHLAEWGWDEGRHAAAGLTGLTGPYYEFRISTAGWSGNESIIAAMQKNQPLWWTAWYSSRRGGHYEFRIGLDNDTRTAHQKAAALPRKKKATRV